MARPRHEPNDGDRRQVEIMAAYGLSEIEIASLLGIDPKTLRKYYPRELSIGHVRANAKVAEVLFHTAVKGGREGTTAAIFWLKTRAGWSEFNAPRLRPPSKRDMDEIRADEAASGRFAVPPPPGRLRVLWAAEMAGGRRTPRREGGHRRTSGSRRGAGVDIGSEEANH
jgi:hypothetical protein